MGAKSCQGSVVISVSMSVGEVQCDIGYDSDAYSIDVMQDMCHRAQASVLTMIDVLAQGAT